MPHRSPAPALRMLFGKPAPRHAGSGLVSRQTKRAIGAFLVVLALVNVVLLVFRLGPPDDDSPARLLPAPAISFPSGSPAATPSPSGTLLLERAVRQTPKPAKTSTKPAGPAHVLLGPSNLQASLTSYCQQTYSRMSMAYATSRGWQCAQAFGRSRSIDMDAACRWLYDPYAFGYLANDTDPQSWRCYRDAP